MTDITDEMVETALMAAMRFGSAQDDGRPVDDQYLREQMRAALTGALAGRAVVELPANWREQIAELEHDECSAASEAGHRPSAEQRAAFEAGAEAAVEWLGARIVEPSEVAGGVL